jgi:hypothetical protein
VQEPAQDCLAKFSRFDGQHEICRGRRVARHPILQQLCQALVSFRRSFHAHKFFEFPGERHRFFPGESISRRVCMRQRVGMCVCVSGVF